MMQDGLVVVDKPAGFTSHDVVAKLRKAYGQRKVGHAGTLDPDATGVLLVGLGRATRLLRYLSESGKAYEGRIVFGDRHEHARRRGRGARPAADADHARRRRAARCRGFLGDIEQLPPMVSAVKVGGRRLHELARAGQEVERAPAPRARRPLRRRGVRTRAVPRGRRRGGVRQRHVRALARRRSRRRARAATRTSAALRRTRVGSFTLAEARPLADIEADPPAAVLPLATAMRDLERVDVDDEQARAVSHGVSFAASALEVHGAGPYALVGPDGALLAVYDTRGAALRPAVVVVGV